MWLFLRRKHIKEFYAEKLYNNKLPYIHNKNFNYKQFEFIEKTKSLIKEEKLVKATNNLKILYYEKISNININNYYDELIEINKLNKEALENEKLLLNIFFGKYLGISSKMYKETMITIPSAVLAGISTEALKDSILNPNKIGVILSLCIGIFAYIVIFMFSMSCARKMITSLRKEWFYGLCLEAINQLIDEFDKSKIK
ncbi:hypothetical protein [Clostridium sp. CH2]|uniref:hypothetical protein n=2 Tax=unclassified Clostridium TaxID=2614128 RepID=UPI00207AD283|nr:hypothetical protein [Clostridium sp. CH2]